jgi:hypothetical protein
MQEIMIDPTVKTNPRCKIQRLLNVLGTARLVQIETVEMSGDDWYWHSQRQYPCDRTRGTDQFADVTFWYFVTVTYCSHRYYRPPERVRN